MALDQNADPTASCSSQQPRSSWYEKGNPGGPGRPKGSRNRATLILDQLARGEAEDILRKVVEVAKEGDLKAAEMVLSRIWPPSKGRPIEFDMPKIENAADIVAALDSITQAVATGELSPEEGAAAAGLLEVQRRAVETAELERRIAALEQRQGGTHARLSPQPASITPAAILDEAVLG